MSLTAQSVRSAKVKRRPYAVSDGAGLSLHVSASGRKTYRFRYRHGGRQESVKLGEHPKLALTAARTKAEELRARVERRQSPAEDARRERRVADPWTTVAEFGARWVDEVVKKARKSPDAVERMLEREVYPAIGKRPLARVTAAEVREIVFRKRDEGHPEAAATLRNLLKRLFEYAQACGLCAENPTASTPAKFVVKHASRTRTLSHAELRAFFQRTAAASVNRRVALALRVILYTLCRKSELRRARWEHIDLERAVWEVPAELSKTGMPHIVYLSRQAVECLRGLKALAGRAEVVLPAKDAVTTPQAASTLNHQIDKIRWGFPRFTPHDLRRTGSTILNELGYNADWIEKALNHATRGIRGVYNRAQYGEQRKQMLQEWADWLEGL